MARYHGKIGYGQSVETPPDSGTWEDVIIEKTYRGDVIRQSRRNDPGENLHPDITTNTSISVVLDDYAVNNFHMIKYVKWAGVLWNVTSVDIQRPRLTLSLGGVYNGPTP